MYRKRQLIPCCVLSYERYKDVDDKCNTLDIRVGDEWVYGFKPPVKDYMYYSHTFSPEALVEYYKQNGLELPEKKQ